MKIKRWMIITVGIIGFVYFYDFTKESHGFYIENGSDQNITILEIVNDNRKIVALREIPLESKRSLEIGCRGALNVSAYGGSTLQVTVKNPNNTVQTASCELKRSNGFFRRLSDDSSYIVTFDGSKRLTYKTHYDPLGPMCDIEEDIGINKKLFKLGE